MAGDINTAGALLFLVKKVAGQIKKIESHRHDEEKLGEKKGELLELMRASGVAPTARTLNTFLRGAIFIVSAPPCEVIFLLSQHPRAR